MELRQMLLNAHCQKVLRRGSCLLALGLAAGLTISPVVAQDSDEEEETQRAAPTIRLQVGDRLNEAQTCVEEEDFDCALEALGNTQRIRDLSVFEQASVARAYASVYYELENYPEAIKSYETIVNLPAEELTPAILQTSMRNLSTLYLQVEPPRPREALDMFTRWMELPGVTPTPRDWYLKAVIAYQLQDYQEGVTALNRAIDLAAESNLLGDEPWYELLFVFYYELEDTDNAINTLEILVEYWPDDNHMRQLAGQFSERGESGDEAKTLALWEAAYDQGWLEASNHLVSLANLHMNAGAPYKAAQVLEKGFADGIVDSTSQNWRTLANAWRLAGNNDEAIPALNRASELAEDGNLDYERALSFAGLAQWDNCVDAARDAVDRGGLNREDQTYLLLGRCLVNLRRYDEARNAFRAAADDDRSREDANRFLTYVQSEVEREAEINRALRELERNQREREQQAQNRN
jgi:tetratricopeptide (TPR) repeat protein